ncbi:MAG: hypothetical protein HQ521_20480, partial [Bacteroidetes bacterium]|nr:hypothetical protein [Bacteroidota bacterium]
MRGTETVAAGVGEYQRTHGTSRNRWGDYSGAALDPVTEDVWIFNEYAMTPGSGNSPEDGRWGTVWGTGAFPLQLTVDNPQLITGDPLIVFEAYPNPFN